MAEYLVIVESPAKAKTIGKFLGKQYKVEASMGHVRDLPKSQMGIDIENNFEPKYIAIRGKASLINKLKKKAQSSEGVFLATDPDREGEAIAWHLATILELKNTEKCRISFNEITKNAVKAAIKAPRQIDRKLVDAQQARRVLDRIVGYRLSPLLWKKVKRGLSAGRVQSVATRLVCDREEEIQNFIPEEYWILSAMLSKKNDGVIFEAKFHGTDEEKIELKSKDQVDGIIKEIGDGSYIVRGVKKGEKKKNPAPPFITSTLQQEASRKLGFSTRKTMMLAQQLYEGIEVEGMGAVGLITYMRTDSVRIAGEAQQKARQYVAGRYGENYIPETFRQYKNKSAVQDAHEAIRPTHMELPPEKVKDSLSGDQYKVYKLIWDRFIASQMAAAIYDTLTVDIAAGKYLFKAVGSKIKFPGFMTLYIEGRDDNDEEKENTIPELSEGETVVLKELNPKQYFTQPPSRYTEATLVKAMEEKGIGRPSTYAPTISTIIDRGYVVVEKKYLYPTELGKIVTDMLKNHFSDIVDVQFTANMEQQLDEIEEGAENWVELIRKFYGPFSNAVDSAEEAVGRVEIPAEISDVKCEKCGRMMVIKQGRFGKFLACPGFPECRNTMSIREETGVNCPKCGKKILIKKSKKGIRYYGCEGNPGCDFMTWDKPLKEQCPKCGGLLVQKAGRAKTVKCSNQECEYVKK